MSEITETMLEEWERLIAYDARASAGSTHYTNARAKLEEAAAEAVPLLVAEVRALRASGTTPPSEDRWCPACTSLAYTQVPSQHTQVGIFWWCRQHLPTAMPPAPGTTETGTRDRLEAGLRSIIANDATRYQHHQARRSDGKTPREVGSGTIFLTPREIAESLLAALPVSRGEATRRECLWHADCDAADRALRPGVSPSHPPLRASPSPGSETPPAKRVPRCKSCGQDLIEGFHYASLHLPPGSETSRGAEPVREDLLPSRKCPSCHSLPGSCFCPASPPPSETPRGAERCAKCGHADHGKYRCGIQIITPGRESETLPACQCPASPPSPGSGTAAPAKRPRGPLCSDWRCRNLGPCGCDDEDPPPGPDGVKRRKPAPGSDESDARGTEGGK